MVVTIDGPVASGKTSVARAIAHQLSWFCMLSGYLYRAVTYALMQQYPHADFHHFVVSDEDMRAILHRLVYQCDAQAKITILYQGVDITVHLKGAAIDQCVSLVSKQQVVRLHLVDIQRHVALQHDNIIVEGRDCGTVVFPDASCKIFLTADPVTRARRWQEDQKRRGVDLSLDECVRFITERDMRDEHRALSPLKIPADAWVLDTTHDTFEEVVARIMHELRARRVTSL